MEVISSTNLNEKALQKDIFRFAATLYAETSDVYSALDSQMHMIKCILVLKNNQFMTSEEIADELYNIYKYHITKDEVINVIERNKKIFDFCNINDSTGYRMTNEEYNKTVEYQEKNIDYYIDAYISVNNIEDGEKFKYAIHQYLYELTTTNINSYQVLMAGKLDFDFSNAELSLDVGYLDEDDKKFIYDFVQWENDEKNTALSNIVFCCLEYCLLINGDKPNKLLLKNIRKREIFLDTNILFRAIGINGESRKRVVTAFLKKCNQAKLKMIVTRNTRKEFFDTIDYYISQIEKFPRGSIYPGAFEDISDYKLFSYYEEWHNLYPNMSLSYFKMHIKSQYAQIISTFNINDDVKIPNEIYDSSSFKEIRNKYSDSIKNKKTEFKSLYKPDDDHYSQKDSHDASVIAYVEILRKNDGDQKDYFFVSSDRLLRYWDMNRRDHSYPIVVYPSQLFLVLVKLCGRSDDDFLSFVNFINIRSSKNQLSAEKANVILSGISSITEDIASQKLIVSAICTGEFQDVIQASNADNELYTKIQEYSQKYLERELEEKNQQIEKTNIVLDETQNELDKYKEKLSTEQKEKQKQADEYEEKIKSLTSDAEKHKEQVCLYAEKKILFKYIVKWYLTPLVLTCLLLILIGFVGLQFFYCDAKWNIATAFINWANKTTFGKYVGDYIYVVDAALAAGVGYLLKKYMRNPWSDNKCTDKIEMIANYINKHHLL